VLKKSKSTILWCTRAKTLVSFCMDDVKSILVQHIVLRMIIGAINKHGGSMTTRSSAIKESESKGNSEDNMHRDRSIILHYIRLPNVKM